MKSETSPGMRINVGLVVVWMGISAVQRRLRVRSQGLGSECGRCVGVKR